MIETIQQWWSNDELRTYIIYPAILGLVYLIYYKYLGYYRWTQEFPFEQTRAHKRRGNPPPSYPNGWFRLYSANDLKPGDVKYVQLNGRHIALFRGEDRIAYALNAFCTHMGANLGIGGQVKWKSCIECPFHGWTFNGKDGMCVNSEEHKPRLVNKFEYQDENFSKGKEGYLKTTEEKCTTHVQSYKLLEQDGEIYIWFHSQNKEPFYQPPALNFPMYTTLEAKGFTQEYINCHIQEIPENGGDFKHFDYVHLYPSQATGTFLKFNWKLQTCFANDPDFYQKMGNHPNKTLREWQIKLFNNMLKDKQNLDNINVLCLDAAMTFGGLFTIPLVTTTVFQIGSGLVYLFFKFPFFEQVLIQGVVPSHAFTQQVTHKQFMTWWVPNWLSFIILKIYLKQVNADQKIWNNKIYDNKVNYVYQDGKDEILKNWRNWYSRYYEGCMQWQKEQTQMEW